MISSNCGFKATKGLFGSIILLKSESFGRGSKQPPWKDTNDTQSDTQSEGGLIYSARDLRFYGGLPPGNFALSEYTNREYWVLDKRFGTDHIEIPRGSFSSDTLESTKR